MSSFVVKPDGSVEERIKYELDSRIKDLKNEFSDKEWTEVIGKWERLLDKDKLVYYLRWKLKKNSSIFKK